MMALRTDPRLVWRENVSQALGGQINPFGQDVDPFKMNIIRRDLLMYWRFPPGENDSAKDKSLERSARIDELRIEATMDAEEWKRLRQERQMEQDEDWGQDADGAYDWMDYGAPFG